MGGCVSSAGNFYWFFLGFLFWMDLGFWRDPNPFMRFLMEEENQTHLTADSYHKISRMWEIPVSIMLKLTIPQSSPSERNRFYRSANIALCPLALMYSCKSFFSLNRPIIFLLPNVQLPLWLIVLFGSSSLALVHFIVETKPLKTEQMPAILGFIMSVFWISTTAGELLNCLGNTRVTSCGPSFTTMADCVSLGEFSWGSCC